MGTKTSVHRVLLLLKFFRILACGEPQLTGLAKRAFPGLLAANSKATKSYSSAAISLERVLNCFFQYHG